ncbi:hypothetical protein [Haloarcula marismortui]|uniref:hypothetical protein n=1 Tax=Haloarcula marismortui TaxID=2238 RepID=UPI001E5B594A|nr:hypothetical protein [Haloarcula sinaiiensis]
MNLVKHEEFRIIYERTVFIRGVDVDEFPIDCIGVRQEYVDSLSQNIVFGKADEIKRDAIDALALLGLEFVALSSVVDPNTLVAVAAFFKFLIPTGTLEVLERGLQIPLCFGAHVRRCIAIIDANRDLV